MSGKDNTMDIRLRGKDYTVACPPEEQEALRTAAAYLDARMAEIASRTRGTGERLAVMTALNLAHELLGLRKDPTGGVDVQEARRRISAMQARLDTLLEPQEDLF